MATLKVLVVSTCWCRHCKSKSEIVTILVITGLCAGFPRIKAADTDGCCWRAPEARKAEQTPRRRTLLLEADTERRSRRRALQNMSSAGCCSSACVHRLGLTGACGASCHCAWPRHGSFQALITLTRRPLSTSRALHVLSSCVLCLAPPAVDLLEALGRCVCTSRACCFCLRICRTFAVSVERLLIPWGWRAVAFPR